jgi:hypothetical protein
MIKDSSETSRFPNFFIFLDILRRARVRRFCRVREQAPRAFGAAPRGFLLQVMQKARTSPRAFGAAPQVWWASWRGFERRGSRGQPHEAHCRSRSALAQNTNAQQVTCLAPLWGAAPKARGACYTFCTTCNKKPTSGGQRRRRGGLVTRSAKPLAGGVSSLSA